MAESYRKVNKPQETLPANEIRVRRGVGIGRYLKRAWDLLNGNDGENDTVVIKGVSNAVQSAVNLAELIKHRVKGLHQINKISNITIVDEFEPLVEGLDHLKFSRVVTMLQITLTKADIVDKSDIGYQPPIPESEVQEYNERERVDTGDRKQGERKPRGQGNRDRRGEGGQRGRGRGRGRGGRGGFTPGFRGRGGGEGYRDDREERKGGEGQGRRRNQGRGGDKDYDDEPRGNRDNRDGRGPRKPRNDYYDDRREGGDNRDRKPDYDGERPRRGGRGARGRGGERRGGGDRGGGERRDDYKRGGERGDGERRGGYRKDRGDHKRGGDRGGDERPKDSENKD